MTVPEYFTALWEQRLTARSLTLRKVLFRDGSQPVASFCHDNVDRWVAENPECSAVRGWIPMIYGFERHSVVRDPSGMLVDITLANAFSFIEHDGSQSLFDWFGEQGFNQVYWPPISN